MDQCRVTAPFLTKNNTTEVAYDRMIYQVVHKKLAEMKQVREGLNALGLADLMDSQPKVTKELFNSVDEATVNFGVLKQTFKHVKVLTYTLQVSSSSVGAGTLERLTLKTLENPMLSFSVLVIVEKKLKDLEEIR
ncbi:unnamed protein product [Porites lobata]|uniref:Uncharacterized protein n=1 Tax=Porites lobata TaxID=104759 RepID=A0ABN8R0N0_9CNID|nr:unnamed protein product [Porites lobata]